MGVKVGRGPRRFQVEVAVGSFQIWGCREEFGELFPEDEMRSEKPRELRIGPWGGIFIQ